MAENAYDSDSSGGSDAERGAAAGNAADGDLDDMFATTAPEPAAGQPPKDDTDRVRDSGLQLRGEAAKGGKATLELHDIEGQEDLEADPEGPMAQRLREGRIGAGDESDGDEEEFVEGDEHANDDDAPRSRRSKKGMGFKIDSFNMKEEMNDGRFTADGCACAGTHSSQFACASRACRGLPSAMAPQLTRQPTSPTRPILYAYTTRGSPATTARRRSARPPRRKPRPTRAPTPRCARRIRSRTRARPV